MKSSTYLYSSILLGFSVLTFGLHIFYRLIEATKISMHRPNMDPLPPMLNKFWKAFMFFDFYFGNYISSRALLRRKQMLDSAGLEFFMTPRETYALQYFSLASGMFFIGISGLSVFGPSILLVYILLLVAPVAWFYPVIWVRDQKKKRNLEISRYFPSFVDIVTLCCECGLTLNTAITNFCERGPACILRVEIERVVRDMKTGAGRGEAMEKFARRSGNPDIKRFVSIVLQCDKLGVPLGPTLKKFSEQKRTERFQRAEKLAMEAPMKMIGPLVMFIFPITFIIIAFPIALTIMKNFN